MAVVLNEDTQFLSDGGKPLTGGSIYIGVVDQDPVANPKTIYSDRELQTVLANPQIIDSNGRSSNKIWLSGRYSMQVNDINGTQVFQDLDRGENTSDVGVTGLSNVIGGDTITAEATPTITGYTDKRIYVFTPVIGNTGPVTLSIDGLDPKPVIKNNFSLLAEDDLVIGKNVPVMYNATGDEFIVVNSIPPIRGHISGLETRRTGGGNNFIEVQPGEAASDEDSGNATIQLTSSISKSIALNWTVGNGVGGLDVGSVADNTWYYVFLIMRSDTGVVDVLFSLNPGGLSQPTLPTNYDRKRRIGSFRTNGSSEIIDFIQEGNRFLWDSPVSDLSAANLGTARVNRQVTIPSGLSGVVWLGGGLLLNTAAASSTFCYLANTSTTDEVPTIVNSQLAIFSAGGIQRETQVQIQIPLSLGFVSTRLNQTGAGISLTLNTYGWIDPFTT